MCAINEETLRRWLLVGIVGMAVLLTADTATAGICYHGPGGWFCL